MTDDQIKRLQAFGERLRALAYPQHSAPEWLRVKTLNETLLVLVTEFEQIVGDTATPAPPGQDVLIEPDEDS